MKRLIAVILIVFLFVPSAVFADSDRVAVSAHYSLYIDALAASAGKGNSYDFDTYCVDLYMLEGNQKAYVNAVTCFSGVFTNSGTVPLSVAERNGEMYFVYENGNTFTGYYDDSGDLWLDLDIGTVRMFSVPYYSPLTDLAV